MTNITTTKETFDRSGTENLGCILTKSIIVKTLTKNTTKQLETLIDIKMLAQYIEKWVVKIAGFNPKYCIYWKKLGQASDHNRFWLNVYIVLNVISKMLRVSIYWHQIWQYDSMPRHKPTSLKVNLHYKNCFRQRVYTIRTARFY